jgi:glycosyltransferase involved in cell wall biosynthesis
MTAPTRWICCQLGAREHFAVARAMHRRATLETLITDAWATPGSPWSQLPGETGRRLSERHSADLATASVEALTASLVAHEALWRLRGLSGWPLVMARNQWFQQRAAAIVAPMASGRRGPIAVFAHSYAALAILREARKRGVRTILGQIDPGEAHLKVVREVAARWPEFGPPLDAPPPRYFEEWREECRLADRIIVNSEWSRELLERAGIEAAKIAIVPLPYQADASAPAFARSYPAAFNAQRPLRVLFVGSVAAFKGVPALLESLELLADAAIELRIVGPMAASIPPRYLADPRIKWIGSVSRSEVMEYCRDSDVLVFPSHSDGFGMAQVEAQEWRLPIIASRSSGRVVRDGENGLLLPEVSAPAIAAAIRQVLDPAVLTKLAQPAGRIGATLDEFGDALVAAAGVLR